MNRQLFFELIPAMPQEDRTRIQWAYALAKKWHEDQKRDFGGRYFEHVRNVALVLIKFGYTDPAYLILAILHDMIEDQFFPPSMLERLFGHEIARELLVVAKTYPIEDPLTGRMFRSPKRPLKEYFEAIRRAGKRPAVAKCADRIDNMSDLVDPPNGSRWTPQKRLRKVAETRKEIIPLADLHDSAMASRLRELCDLIEQNVRLQRSRKIAARRVRKAGSKR
ncbi:MAG: HD domain-containing protein [bacterium]|nr:HD domain-containing protein [bacterium]